LPAAAPALVWALPARPALALDGDPDVPALFVVPACPTLDTKGVDAGSLAPHAAHNKSTSQRQLEPFTSRAVNIVSAFDARCGARADK